MNLNRSNSDQILLLSLKQTYQRLALWIRINIWAVMLSLPILSYPAAKAALYHSVRISLLDPFDLYVIPRNVFMEGFRLHFRRALLVSSINLVVNGAIILSLIFWITREQDSLKYISLVTLFFALVWWLSQSFLYPYLVEHPELSIWQVYQRVFQLTLAFPLKALVFGMARTAANFIGLLLLGPSLLAIPTLSALIGIQGLWDVTGQEIPDLIDPVEYTQKHSYDPSPR